MPSDKPAGTVEIGADFVGLKDADGNVLIDDTAFFQQREREQPLWDAIAKSEQIRRLRGALDTCLALVAAEDAQLAQQIRVTQGWVEHGIVAVCAGLIEEAKKNGD